MKAPFLIVPAERLAEAGLQETVPISISEIAFTGILAIGFLLPLWFWSTVEKLPFHP